MEVFIFGAGASLGSQPEHSDPSCRPPLVNELFSKQYRKWANDVGLPLAKVQEYQDARSTNTSLEDWLTAKWTEAEKKEEQFRAAELTDFGRMSFYVWWLLQGISRLYTDESAYRVLLRRLRKKEVPFALISFNYDTLLDRAYQDEFGYPLSGNLEAYRTAKLLKPHGSVNWFFPKRNQDPQISGEMVINSAVRFRMASHQMFNGEPLPLHQLRVFDPTHDDLNKIDFIGSGAFASQYFYPLIFMPLRSKQYSFVADFYQQIVTDGQKYLAQADNVHLIGYRAEDEVIVDLLRDVRDGTPIHVVSRSSAETIADSLIRRVKKLRQGKLYNDGFQQFAEQYS